jgi:hypothetical protein
MSTDGLVDNELDYEEELMNCGLQRDGACLYAGTEHCDFDCRIRDDDQEAEGG